MHLTQLPQNYAVARAAPDAQVPDGVLDAARTSGFVTVSRTDEELSVVAPVALISGMDKVEDGWTVFKVKGPFAFDEVGIVAQLSRALATARIGIFVISTYDTDYILVKAGDSTAAISAWRADGHTVDTV